MTKVINFYGGPSAGKSTMANKLMGWMKEQRMNVEFVPEFAKQLTWQKAYNLLDDQLFILGNQNQMLYTLRGQVDYVITDSPLLLQLHYVDIGFSKWRETRSYLDESIKELILATYAQYDNVNFFVERGDRKFVQAGRNQNEEQAKEIDDIVFRTMSRNMIPFKRVASLNDVPFTLGLVDA